MQIIDQHDNVIVLAFTRNIEQDTFFILFYFRIF